MSNKIVDDKPIDENLELHGVDMSMTINGKVRLIINGAGKGILSDINKSLRSEDKNAYIEEPAISYEEKTR